MYLRPGFIVVVVGVTLTSLSTIVVFLRYYCRWYRMGVVGITEHLMFIALVLTWGNTVINYYQDVSSSKFRLSHFRKPEKRPKAEAALHVTLVTWYIYRMSYGVALCFVKLSILFFYRTIASNRKFRRIVYATIYFVILYTIATTLASAFQCRNPRQSYDISGYLSQFDRGPKKKEEHGKCYDPARFWVFTSAVNLFTDVLIMLMPIPTLMGLRVPMSKRLALISIFSIGIVGIVASCVRMWVMALWAESPQNSARFGSDLLLWGQVETNAGIISASIPFLRLFFQRRNNSTRDSNEKPAIKVRVKDISPPQPIHMDNKPLKDESMAFFGGEDDERGPNGSPMWKPFITVPESLSSRGSGMLEPSRVHATV